MTYGEAESNLILDRLVNQWAVYSDAKKTADQLQLMAPDGTYRIYQDNQLLSETTGRENLSRLFTTQAGRAQHIFTLTGTHLITVDQNAGTATGILNALVKVVRTAENGQSTLTSYSERYDDQYAFQGENWVISERNVHRIIVDQHDLTTN